MFNYLYSTSMQFNTFFQLDMTIITVMTMSMSIQMQQQFQKPQHYYIKFEFYENHTHKKSIQNKEKHILPFFNQFQLDYHHF